MRGRARALAAKSLRENVEVFEGCGFRREPEVAPLEATVRRNGLALRLRMAPQGGLFGGSFALEIASAAPLAESRGLVGRGRGVVRLSRLAFRPRRGDLAGERLAAQLEADGSLQAALARVHFERVRVDPAGSPVIRHMGGSVVWVLFPPLVRAVPLVPEQAEASARALEAFGEVPP
ncbi:MAG: DUF3156 family protein [Actinobacteria bacterium]|nr:DUF3156 family protein [Actinomycetota bacterium]